MKVAVLGNLAGVSNDVVKCLRAKGVDADLFIRHSERHSAIDDLDGQEGLDPAWIRYLDPPPFAGRRCLQWTRRAHRMIWQLRVVVQLLKYDLLHVHTGALNFSAVSHLLFVRCRLRPYLAFATGSDVREVALYDRGIRGWLMRGFLRHASSVLLLNTDMLGIRDELGLPGAEFFPFLIDEVKHCPCQDDGRPAALRGKLLCFMMSRLDFGISDRFPGRSSMKSNDRVFHALKKFSELEPEVHLVVIDQGADRELARDMVASLGICDLVTFKEQMTEIERVRHLYMADIVLDQFSVGAFGLGALEALSVGKPLITYLQEDCAAASYGDEIPILNAQTADDIYRRLVEARDPALRGDLSLRARAWIIEHHSREVVTSKLVRLYEGALAK